MRRHFPHGGGVTKSARGRVQRLLRFRGLANLVGQTRLNCGDKPGARSRFPENLHRPTTPLQGPAGVHDTAPMFLDISIVLVTIALIVVCLLLILLVLMQRPKQEGLGAAFGAGVTDQIWGSQTTNVLQKGTVYMGVLLFVLSLTLAMMKATKARELTGIKLKDEQPTVVPAPSPETPATPASTTSTPVPTPAPGSTTTTPPATTPPAENPATAPASESKPAETSPAETKPTDTPAAPPPAESAPDSPPAESKPAADSKPAAGTPPATPPDAPPPAPAAEKPGGEPAKPENPK